MADSKLEFQLVSKAHACTAWFFAAVFIFSSFGLSLPVLGPAALLLGWDAGNPSLVMITRLAAGLMTGVGCYEWVFASDGTSKKPFVYYHIVLAVLTLWSSVAAANGALGWLYAILVTLFLIAGILGTTEDSTTPMESLSDSSKTPLVAQCHAAASAL